MKVFLVATVAVAALAHVCLAATDLEVEAAVDKAFLMAAEDAQASAAAREGAKASGRHKKVTKESRLMDEYNQVVANARKILMDADPELERAAADRQVINAVKRKYMNGVRTPGGHTGRLSAMSALCEKQEASERCEFGARYRSITGECNNLREMEYGAASTVFPRLRPAAYADGVEVPRGGVQSSLDTCEQTGNKGAAGDACTRPATVLLPNPRRVSTMIHPNLNKPDRVATLMVMQMGQFLDHDLTLSPEREIENVECCTGAKQGNFHEGCIPIVSPCNDRTFVDRLNENSNTEDRTACTGVIPLTRSVPFCEGNTTVREHMNVLTAFVDASNVYGSTEEVAEEIRTHVDGLLKTEPGDLLPLLPNEMTGVPEATAGDVRARENPGLAGMHTIFLREHNRIARELKRRRPSWNDETLYQQARRIVAAEMQNVVYGQYVREIVGPSFFYRNGLRPSLFGSRYNPSVNPSINTEFATAAFRFGHSMIQDLVFMINLRTRRRSTFLLRDHFFNTTFYEQDLDGLLTGMIGQRAQSMDENVASAVTESLFATVGLAGDLVARNIQRGREHGVPGYNEYRELCGLPKACSFSQTPSNIDSNLWKKLAAVYDSPADIDLFTGGMVEDSVPGGHLGHTFACIISAQFRNIKDGDRFFYTHNPLFHYRYRHRSADADLDLDLDAAAAETEVNGDEPAADEAADDRHHSYWTTVRNPYPFNIRQLQNLMSRDLGDIMCDNTGLPFVRENVFRTDSRLVSCGRRYAWIRQHSKLNLGLFA